MNHSPGQRSRQETLRMLQLLAESEEPPLDRFMLWPPPRDCACSGPALTWLARRKIAAVQSEADLGSLHYFYPVFDISSFTDTDNRCSFRKSLFSIELIENDNISPSALQFDLEYLQWGQHISCIGGEHLWKDSWVRSQDMLTIIIKASLAVDLGLWSLDNVKYAFFSIYCFSFVSIKDSHFQQNVDGY